MKSPIIFTSILLLSIDIFKRQEIPALSENRPVTGGVNL